VILRVFPRRTNATPCDEYSRIGGPQLFDPLPEVVEVHISVTFTWDIRAGEALKRAYEIFYPRVLIGGPALDNSGGEFIPGRYMSIGNVITSRGCPNRCWYCYASKREGNIRELKIKDGWKIHDNNILACSKKHFEAVCEMLSRQPEPSTWAGGLEARRLTARHTKILSQITPKPKRLYFANDRKGDLIYLKMAADILHDAGFNREQMYCYVLIGYPGDSVAAATKRLYETLDAGYFTFAMLFRDDTGWSTKRFQEWSRLQREWARPQIIRSRLNESQRINAFSPVGG